MHNKADQPHALSRHVPPQEDKRKTVKLKDMEKAIQAIEVYDFLTTVSTPAL